MLSAAIKKVSVMPKEKHDSDLKYVFLSRHTVSQHITVLSEDVKLQLLDKLKQNLSFTLQFDESTNVVSLAQLLA
jgi:hypothetical protein